MINDPVYVDAAKAFATRVLAETPGAAVNERLEHAFRLAVLRPPQLRERAALRQLFDDQLAASRAAPDETQQFVGSEPLRGVSAAEFVALFAVTSALLNLDETITKG